MSNVKALPVKDKRPENALSWLSEVLAETEASSVLVFVFKGGARASFGCFGDMQDSEVAWAGAWLLKDAVARAGEDE